jgi:hypothetical protein
MDWERIAALAWIAINQGASFDYLPDHLTDDEMRALRSAANKLQAENDVREMENP